MSRRTDPPPVLAIVRSTPTGDGVGYVGLLLRRALHDLYGSTPRVIALDAKQSGQVSVAASLKFVWRLGCAQLRRPPAPLVFNHIGIARAARLVPWPLRRPYAVFLNGIEVWDPQLDEERLGVIRRAAVRMSISHFTARRVTEVHGDLGPIDVCPLALLPQGAAAPEPDRTAARHLLRTKSPRVAIVGRMSIAERYKGHDELLEAWPLVRQSIPEAQLVVIGRGDDVDRLRLKAAELQIAAAVTFTGFLEDSMMRAVLSECDVFAMPSRGEGFGLTYLEAMRAGLPCIGTTADAAVDVIEPDRTGILVSAGDPNGLADAIVRLLRDPGLRKRMGEAGRDREAQIFSFANFRSRVGIALSKAG